MMQTACTPAAQAEHSQLYCMTFAQAESCPVQAELRPGSHPTNMPKRIAFVHLQFTVAMHAC